MLSVSLHVLLWNNERDLPDLLRSIKQLHYPELTVRFLDNGSVDGSRAYLKEHAPEWLTVCNAKNTGFAGGHNQLFQHAIRRQEGKDPSQHVIFIVNADMILESDILSQLLRPFEDDARCGAVQPKVRRILRPEYEGEEPRRTSLLDTAGLVLPSSWRCEDRGAGAEDGPAYNESMEIFGAGGACAAYRLSALLDSADEDGMFFDGDFFAYREDCDLAMRLRRRGWNTIFSPSAQAWHYRSMFGEQKRSLVKRLLDRRRQQGFRNALALRNQLFFLIKHFPILSGIRYLPLVLFGECGRLVYGILCEKESRNLLFSSLRLFPKMLIKRKFLNQKSPLSSRNLLKYVGKY